MAFLPSRIFPRERKWEKATLEKVTPVFFGKSFFNNVNVLRYYSSALSFWKNKYLILRGILLLLGVGQKWKPGQKGVRCYESHDTFHVLKNSLTFFAVEFEPKPLKKDFSRKAAVSRVWAQWCWNIKALISFWISLEHSSNYFPAERDRHG